MGRMARRAIPWLLALPLMTVGSLAAHSLAYLLVEPSAAQRGRLLESTGHGYLSTMPFLLGACGALVLAGTLAYATRALRGSTSALPAWPLALVPLVGFTLQEHLERLLSGSAVSPLEPTFLVGLALQLPFALAALLVARRVAVAAEALGKILAGPPRTRPRPGHSPRPPVAILLSQHHVALAHRERGPPH